MASSVSSIPTTTHAPLADAPLASSSTIAAETHTDRAESSAQASEREHRPQAGPLPPKRGEIGFVEGVHHQAAHEASSNVASLPARHPADRDAPPAIDAASSTPTASQTLTVPAPAPGDAQPRSPSPATSTATNNSTSKRSFISFLSPSRTIGGLRVLTLGVFFLELAALGGTIAGWVLMVRHMGKSGALDLSEDGAGTGADAQTQGAMSWASSQIFVHVAFGVATLALLVFLERCVFRLRAERYMHKHPGAILPTSRQQREAVMGIAPWNRPPLPTYAAALAQSGVGTGDVEDAAIAVPPPPAYGNTRGSRLLLSGFLTQAMMAERPRDSTGSARTQASRGSRGSRATVRRGTPEDEEQDRPKSYMSTDPEWEDRLALDRALQLEETLARLEDGNGADGAARRHAS